MLEWESQMEPRRIESLHFSGSILEWDSKNEPRRIQSLHSSGSILERESHMEPRRIQSLYCSGSILKWESHMEPRTIESLHCSDSRLGCDSQNPTVMQRLDPGEVSRYTVATPVSIQIWNVIPNFRIRESQMEPRRIESLHCSDSFLEWGSQMEHRRI